MRSKRPGRRTGRKVYQPVYIRFAKVALAAWLCAVAVVLSGVYGGARLARAAGLNDPNSAAPPSEPAPDSADLPEGAAWLLPDLQTLPPSGLRIENLPEGGRQLRLANTIWNSGQGTLELLGEFNPVSSETRVYQRIYAAGGEQHARLVGDFVWHPGHDHFHFEDFTLYELWGLKPNGALDAVLSSSDKLSYCVIDTNPVDQELEGFPTVRLYHDCDESLQGLSVGWGDRYKSSLDGQSLDLSGIPDGVYALKSTANPDARLLETDYSNNAAVLLLEIAGLSLRILPSHPVVDSPCYERCGS